MTGKLLWWCLKYGGIRKRLWYHHAHLSVYLDLLIMHFHCFSPSMERLKRTSSVAAGTRTSGTSFMTLPAKPMSISNTYAKPFSLLSVVRWEMPTVLYVPNLHTYFIKFQKGEHPSSTSSSYDPWLLPSPHYWNY